MKNKIVTIAIALIFPLIIIAQPVKKTVLKEKVPPQSEANRMMEDAMKGMSEEEKAEMRKMMKEMMPEITKKPGSDAIPFTDNKKLVPAKDFNRINSISKKAFTDADINANTQLLYSKLMAKIPLSEKAITTRVLSQVKDGSSLMSAATTSFMQGHYQVAMALAMKAVQADPQNAVFQNNLAAILSQNGYPENAVPYLKKLSLQFPSNSTVLNNLGYAWLALGDVDSARRYFAYSAIGNPNHPETNLCRGLIEELKGDPQKAADDYVKSFEDVPNPFTESMINNVKAGDRIEAMDFEKMKSKITIHEYFPKDWFNIPVLSDNVSGYENDRAIQNGYEKMFENLLDTITLMIDASNEQVDKLADKGETEFGKTMMKESIKGLNMMSMPAVYVQKILQPYVYKWTENYTKELDALREDISAKRKEITKSRDNDKCPDFDRKNNDLMAYANPLIRKFYAKKIEEFRTWLNAFCTWTWYITGNPKNVTLTQCITWTTALVEMYRSAIHDQESIAKSCVKQNGDGINSVTPPVIPNFTCPAIVRIPIGLDELRLGAETNFDDNEWSIKQADGISMPNVTLGFSMGKNDIAEPGKYGNPYVKTGNGSINASGINYGDSDGDDLMPLSKIMDELTALPKIPLDELAPLDPRLLNQNKKLTGNDLKKIHSAELARRILNKMMSTKCQQDLLKKKVRKQKFVVGIGESKLDDVWDEESGAWIDENGKPRQMIFGIGESKLYEWDDEVKAFFNSKGEQVDKDFKPVGISKVQFLNEVTNSGPQPVINNGLGFVDKAIGFIKGLFN
jgi:Tfp pilus assembly protein PilF